MPAAFIILVSAILMGATITCMSATTWGQRIDWPFVWELLVLPWPKNIRDNIYEPAHKDLLADCRRAARAIRRRKKYSRKWVRTWISFCFLWRTFLLIAACCRAILPKIVPDNLRRWWRGER